MPKGLIPRNKLGEGELTAVWEVGKEGSAQSIVAKLALDADPTRRLEREFSLLKRFEHPGIVKVYEFGHAKGFPYFTMEFVKGLPFDEFFSARRRDKGFLELFLEVLAKTMTLVSVVHSEGVVHVDIKPLNLLISEDAEPVLLDFGFAEDYLLAPTHQPRGTLAYVAPEMFLGGDIGPAADLYSLGVMAYETLTGKNLWDKLSPRSLVAAKTKPVQGFANQAPYVPAELENVLLRLLQPDPALRPGAFEVAGIVSSIFKGKRSVPVARTGFAPRLVFGGREKELMLAERMLFEGKKVVLLKGARGTGKTRFLQELRFRGLVKQLNLVYLEGRGGYLSVTEHLAQALSVPQLPQNAQDVNANYERVLQAIYRSGLDALLLDAPPDLSAYEEKGLEFLAKGVEGKCGLLMAGAEDTEGITEENLVLSPLGRKESEELLARTFEGLKNKAELADTLYAETEGNPAMMDRLLDILYTEGWLRFEDGWIYEKPRIEGMLKEKTTTWMRERLDTLPAGSITVLRALALAEGPIPLATLFSAFEDLQIAWITRMLTDRGVIDSVSYLGLPHYNLKDILLRGYVLENLSARERHSLSSKLAKSLERYCRNKWGEASSTWADPYLVQLAKLYSKAGNRPEAPAYLLEAGNRLSGLYLYRQARQLLANVVELEPVVKEKKSALVELGRIADIHEEAELSERYYSQALALAEGDPDEQAGIWLRAGLAHQRVHHLDRAEELFKRSEGLTGGVANLDLLAARGWNAMMKGDYTWAEALCRKSLDKAETLSETRRRALYMLVWVLFQERRFKDALEYAQMAMKENETAGDKGGDCQATLIAADCLQRLGRLNEAQEYVEKVLESSKGLEYPHLAAEALRRQSILLGFKGHFRQARSLGKEALRILERINDKISIPSSIINTANQSRDLGDWREAEQGYLELWKLIIKSPLLGYLRPHTLTEWGSLLVLEGNLLQARLMAEYAEKLALLNKDPIALAWSYIVRARIALNENDHNKCKAIISAKELGASVVQDVNTLLNIRLMETELLLDEESNKETLEMTKRLVDEIETYGFLNLSGEALRLWGKCLIKSGDIEGGLVKFRESAILLKEEENLYEQGRSLFALAEATFNVKGYCDEAIAPLEEASAIFERLGAVLELERIERFRARNFTEWRSEGGLSPQYLGGLKKISELINYRLGEEDFMLDLLAVTLELTGAERGIIFLMEEAQLYAVASKRMDSTTQGDARRISKTVIRRIQQGLQPIYTTDATTDERFSRSRSIFLNNIRSILCIPLKTNERLLGTIYLDSQSIGLFDLDKVAYFEALGNLLAATIDKSAEFTRLREELVLSKEGKKWQESGVVLGNSKAMRGIYNQLERVALSEANVLLEGETGTGKGVLARMIHEKSLRRAREFCSLNCGVLPENLFEWELFGYRKGTFTGASSDRIGLLEAADGSTVFFDEITNTSLAMQAKLLEVIDERVIRRFGESRKRKVDLRFIFATNRALKQEVKEGRFREDLYFRLNTLNLRIPPLRERKEDIPEFTRFFIDKFARELNKRINEVSEEVMEAMVAYPWPGNIRELANVIERAVLLAQGRRLTRDFLDQRFFPEGGFQVHDLREAKRVEEQELIRRILLETGGNVTRAARRIGVSRQHLSRLISRYKISRHTNKL